MEARNIYCACLSWKLNKEKFQLSQTPLKTGLCLTSKLVSKFFQSKIDLEKTQEKFCLTQNPTPPHYHTPETGLSHRSKLDFKVNSFCEPVNRSQALEHQWGLERCWALDHQLDLRGKYGQNITCDKWGRRKHTKGPVRFANPGCSSRSPATQTQGSHCG